MDRWKAAEEALGNHCGLPDEREAPGCWDLQSRGLQPCLAGGLAPWAVGAHPIPARGCCPLLFLTALPGYWGAGGSAPVATRPMCAKVMPAFSLSLWQEPPEGWGVREEKPGPPLVGLNYVYFFGRFRLFIVAISWHYKMWELGKFANWRRLINILLGISLQKLFLCLEQLKCVCQNAI